MNPRSLPVGWQAQSAIIFYLQTMKIPVIPVYHLVADEVPPHIRHLYGPRTKRQFEEDLDYFRSHYPLLDVGDLYKGKRNGFLVTVDDGLSEVYTVMRPIFLKKGIRPLLFLNPAFIDNKDIFYRYKASILVEELKKKKYPREIWTKMHQVYDDLYPGQRVPRSILKTPSTHRHYLDRVAGIIGLDFKDYLKKVQPYLTRDQIGEMVNDGFIFGGHGVDHHYFPDLSPEEQIQQAVESTRTVMEWTGSAIPCFAFPFTDWKIGKDFFDQLYAALGGEVLTFGTAGLKRDSIPLNFQRIPVENYSTGMRGIMLHQRMKALLRSIAGSNIIKRV